MPCSKQVYIIVQTVQLQYKYYETKRRNIFFLPGIRRSKCQKYRIPKILRFGDDRFSTVSYNFMQTITNIHVARIIANMHLYGHVLIKNI